MSHIRNVDGLVDAGRKRTIEKTEQVAEAISNLRKRGIPITFEVVALEAKCSRAFLYKHPEIKQKIEALRSDATSAMQKAPKAERRSEASNDKIVMALKDKIERIQGEKRELKAEIRRLNTALEKALGQLQHWKDMYVSKFQNL